MLIITLNHFLKSSTATNAKTRTAFSVRKLISDWRQLDSYGEPRIRVLTEADQLKQIEKT